VAVLDARTLVAAADEVGGPEDSAVLLVPHAERTRPALLSAVRDRRAVVGPARPWTAAASSFRRALRAATRLSWTGGAALDTEQHLLELVLAADPEALADLRSRALAPLEAVRPAAAERLAETLRVWLLLQGRRDEVAAALHVHPQTVRYRMTQVRELYGERLSDPDVVAQLVVALARPDAATAPRRQA
jgi:DNA-binding PucR family transcriptional regulator